MHSAVFLDRDGVIVENRPSYVRSWEEVSFFPQALTALQALARMNCLIIMVTNQSVVGQKLISLRSAMEINLKLRDHIQSSAGRIDGIYVCPHTPMDACTCRKPMPGLLLQASSDFAIDLHQSILIGDALSDIQAGQAVGIHKTILVKTGLGRQQPHRTGSLPVKPYLIADTLLDAVALLD